MAFDWYWAIDFMEYMQLHCQNWIGRLYGRVMSPPIFSWTERREQTTHSMLVYESWREEEEDHGNHEMPRSDFSLSK